MNTQDFKRKLTAVFSADVAGYSRLMGADEVATVKTLEAYKQVMFSLIRQHRGRVVDSPGDNLLAEFASVVDAVQCGVAIQNELKARNADLHLPENRRMQFRIGINLGDVIEEEDRIYGDGVNIAARLESCADPGGICVSKTAFDHIETKLPLGYEYLGEKEVKNIAKPVGAYRVLMEPRVTVAETKNEKHSIPFWRRKGILAGALAVLVVIIGVSLWNFFFRFPTIEPASKEKMAFPLPDKPSIAVLPFVNMSGDPNQDFFSDGITEEIISALSRVSGLFVIARKSSFTYKGKSVWIPDVARDLGVQYILEGSVRRAGDRVRITAQLIDGKTNNHIWSETYGRELKDIFAVQDEITMKILTKVKVKLTGGEDSIVPLAKRANDLQVYLKILEGESHNRANQFLEARRLFEEALSLDPKSPAYSGLAMSYVLDAVFGPPATRAQALGKAVEFGEECIEQDETNEICYRILCYAYTLKRDYEKALHHGRKAIEMNPNSAFAASYLSSP